MKFVPVRVWRAGSCPVKRFLRKNAYFFSIVSFSLASMFIFASYSGKRSGTNGIVFVHFGQRSCSFTGYVLCALRSLWCGLTAAFALCLPPHCRIHRSKASLCVELPILLTRSICAANFLYLTISSDSRLNLPLLQLLLHHHVTGRLDGPPT